MAREAENLENLGAEFEEVMEVLASGGKPEIMLQAQNRGNFYERLGIDVDCYVLDDEDKTVVISKTGMAKALRMSDGGDRITRLVNSKKMAKFPPAEILAQKIDNPIYFKGLKPAKNPEIHGYDITILADVCDLIVDAYKDGTTIKKELFDQARSLQKAAQKLGWKSLGWAVAGYRPHEEEVIESFRQFLVEEISRQYSKEFPVELYLEWSKLYGFPLRVGRNFHVKCRWLTIKHVYEPLLRSNGRLLRMLRDARYEDPTGKHKKLFQYLNDELGMPAIRRHLAQLQAIAVVADNLQEYEKSFNILFGDHQLELPFEFND